MNRLLFTFALLSVFVFTTTAQDKPFELSGSVQGKNSGKIYLILSDFYNERIMDSTILLNGKFTFKGTIPHSVFAFLSADALILSPEKEPNAVSFFLDPGKTAAELVYNDFKNIRLTGAATDQAYKTLESETDYIAEHPNSVLSAFLLNKITSLEKRKELFKTLAEEVRQSGFGQRIQRSIDESERGVPGTKALDFTAVDIRGDTLRLSDFRGKYVLIDFWASWCLPCRASHPHLLELYAKYKDKGFEIIAVADDDRNPAVWRKAVESDKVSVWRHILRGLDMEKAMKGNINFSNHPNEISTSKYGITSLPTEILVDPSGTISGRYNGISNGLEEKLEEIFRTDDSRQTGEP
jgi:thiol-disulfide isomerase/thioredoxin